jgi:hypothetical protein
VLQELVERARTEMEKQKLVSFLNVGSILDVLRAVFRQIYIEIYSVEGLAPSSQKVRLPEVTLMQKS